MNYSFRKKNKTVKYIVIHYTGMKSLKSAYQKLSNNNSNVSSHYLISKNGNIYNLLCPKFKAWHAGKSKWRTQININDYSIGIELENKGHDFGYSSFSKNQYASLKKLVSFLKKNFNIDELLVLYGFHKTYIKKYKNFCIKAVKRSLNYSEINTYQNKKFLNDFYNLLFR